MRAVAEYLRMEGTNGNSSKVVLDGVASAKAVGLRYTTDNQPGLRRVPAGRGFRYLTDEGKTVRDPATLRRIKSLAIPPAWTDVWISADPQGHLQATGRDDKSRKQHRYHPRWREVRDETKYSRMVAFGRALPKIRARTRKDLRQPGLGRRKVLATIVCLLELSAIRVGNDEYARQNRSFGLTTLQDRHARVRGSTVRFQFRGKSGRDHAVDVTHPRVARIVKQCQDLAGQELFQYLDDEGARRDVTSGDVNEYLREITGQDFTAKDFRTWTGTVLAALALREFDRIDSKVKARKNIGRAIENVAKRLGNTPSVCRKCYVHPVILESYLDGSLLQSLQRQAAREMTSSLSKLRPEEAAVLALLQKTLRESRDPSGTLQRRLSQSLRRESRRRKASRTAVRPKNGGHPSRFTLE